MSAVLSPPVAETLFRDNWPRRRRWMSIVLAWAMLNSQLIIIAAIIKWAENALLIQALIALLALIASLIGAYVFGATWDDNDKRRHLAGREDFNPYGQTEPTKVEVTQIDNPPPGFAQ